MSDKKFSFPNGLMPFHLKLARVSRGLKLSDLSKLTGIHVSSLSRFETGKAQPTPAMLERLSDELGIKTVAGDPGEGVFYLVASPEIMADVPVRSAPQSVITALGLGDSPHAIYLTNFAIPAASLLAGDALIISASVEASHQDLVLVEKKDEHFLLRYHSVFSKELAGQIVGYESLGSMRNSPPVPGSADSKAIGTVVEVRRVRNGRHFLDTELTML